MLQPPTLYKFRACDTNIASRCDGKATNLFREMNIL
jgi:hypothetical protein